MKTREVYTAVRKARRYAGDHRPDFSVREDLDARGLSVPLNTSIVPYQPGCGQGGNQTAYFLMEGGNGLVGVLWNLNYQGHAETQTDMLEVEFFGQLPKPLKQVLRKYGFSRVDG
ncbi:hypothetical protein ACFL0V_04305 [Nanoarchaeota archaeon]